MTASQKACKKVSHFEGRSGPALEALAGQSQPTPGKNSPGFFPITSKKGTGCCSPVAAEGGKAQITGTFPAGVISTNLKEATAGENHEYTIMYPEYVAKAQEQGFPEIAAAMKTIAVGEKQHEKRYLELMANVNAGRISKRDEVLTWRCLNCGYLHKGKGAPGLCPAFAHRRAHFGLLGENW